jgi:hypothetical protein
MPADRLVIQRKHLERVDLVPDPDATRPLDEGQARLAIDRFALTANNITYAAFGEAMKYWQFFPAPAAPGGVAEPLGCLPVWGYAVVSESRHPGLAVGRRAWGYYPAGTHLVVEPGRCGASGFVDAAPPRAGLAAVYNQYAWCDADPGWSAAVEPAVALLRPLFTTSFLIDDFLEDNAWFGAKRMLVSSASSKTAFGTAFCLAPRAQRPELVGLTSQGNLEFTRGLGCYDRVLSYAELPSLDAAVPTVYVDFSGDAALRRAVHERFAHTLRHSASIGGTHWRELGSAGGLPGPRPTLFFAPAQIERRSAAPPTGWGADGFRRRLGEAWIGFLARALRADSPWLRVQTRRGPQALRGSYLELLQGRADPRIGIMIEPAA